MDRLRFWCGQEKQVVDMACTTHTGNIRADNEDNFYFEGKYMPERHGSLEEIYVCRKTVGLP